MRIEKLIDRDRQATKTLSILTAGDFFGEMSVVDAKPRSASAVAGGATRLICLSRGAFEALLGRNHAAAVRLLFAMMQAMNERIRRLNINVVAYDEIGKAIGETDRLQPLLDLVLRQLCQAVGATTGLLLLKLEFAAGFELRSAENFTPTVAQKEALADARGVLRPVCESGRELLVNDSATDSRLAQCERMGWEMASLLMVPVLVRTGLLGIIVLAHASPGRFDLNHANLVSGIARQTAQAILNARHREEEQARARRRQVTVRF